MYLKYIQIVDYKNLRKTRLKESDFSECLGDWRGHWIIISAFFDQITDADQQWI